MFSQGTQLNFANSKTSEQLAYEKSIKDAMIKKAMQGTSLK